MNIQALTTESIFPGHQNLMEKFSFNEEHQLIRFGDSVFTAEGEMIVNEGNLLNENMFSGLGKGAINLLSKVFQSGDSKIVKTLSKTAKVGGAAAAGIGASRGVESLHSVLDVLEWVPFVGNFAMGVHAIVYAFEMWANSSGSEKFEKAKWGFIWSGVGMAFPYLGKLISKAYKAGKTGMALLKNGSVRKSLVKISEKIMAAINKIRRVLGDAFNKIQNSDIGKKLFTGKFNLNAVKQKMNEALTFFADFIKKNFSKAASKGGEVLQKAKAAFKGVKDPELASKALNFSKNLNPKSWYKPNFSSLRKIIEKKQAKKVMVFIGKKTPTEKAYPLTQRNLDILRKKGQKIRLAPVPMDIYEKLAWVGAGIVVAAGIFNGYDLDEKVAYAFYSEEDQEMTSELEQVAPKGEEQAETGETEEPQTKDQETQGEETPQEEPVEPAVEENKPLQFSYVATDGQRKQASGEPSEHSELGVRDELEGAEYYKKTSHDGPNVFALKDNKIFYYRNGEWVVYRTAKII